MILLNRNAEQIFWLGRYLNRIEYLCDQFPFQNNAQALKYAHAFCLPAFDAESLNALLQDPEQPASFNQQFQSSKNNIQDLRGVLSAHAYAELHQLIKNAHENLAYIGEVAVECHEVLEAAAEDIFLFFSLGQNIEQLDRQMRLKQQQAQTLKNLDHTIDLLNQMGWNKLNHAWHQLKLSPDSIHLYHFHDHMQTVFEVDV